MPYIGNTAGNRFVASKSATQFSGNGSTTAFTLEHSVASDEDILVSVDGVIQEPSVAYAVSNGTTLTFTGAPSSGTNNIFVCYLFRTVATVDHPSTSSLQATDGTFTSTLDVTGNVGLGGANTSSYLQGVVGGKTATIGDGSQASSALVLKDDDGVFDIATTAGTLRIYDDNNERLRMDSTGAVTIPNQPAFLVQPSGIQTNFPLNTETTLTYNLERFDVNSDFDTSTYTFTAPVTGKYLFSFNIYLLSIDHETSYFEIFLRTSNRTYAYILDNTFFDTDVNNFTQCWSVVADMDASDTAYVSFLLHNSGTAQMDLHTPSYFSGVLVC